MAKPVIKARDCIGCGICVDDCPMSVLDIEEDKVILINIDDCIGCGNCEENCPMGAIEMSNESD